MAQIDDWINVAGGNWSVGGNWNTGTVPGASAVALIDNAGSAAVAVTDAEAVSLLVFDDAAATFDVLGSLAIGAGFTLDAGLVLVDGSLSTPKIDLAGGTLDLAGTIAAAIITVGPGSQVLTGDTSLLDVSDLGSLAVAAGLILTVVDATVGTLRNAGTTDVAGNVVFQTLDNTGGTIDVESGNLAIGSSSTTVTLPELGQINAAGGSLYIGSVIDLGGGSFDTSQLPVAGNYYPSLVNGTISVDSSVRNLTVSNATVFTNDVTFIVDNGMNSTFVTSGTNTTFELLDHSTVEGPLYALAGAVQVEDGLTVLAGPEGGVGTIYGGLGVYNTETFDNAVVVLGTSEIATSNLVLGTSLVVEASGGGGLDAFDGTLVNNGSITAQGGTFTVHAMSFTNNAEIDVTDASVTILMEHSTVENNVFLGPNYLFNSLTDGFRNDGILDVSSATSLQLDALVGLSELGTIAGSDATLVVVGAQASSGGSSELQAATLDLGGGTLEIGEADNFNELDLQGVVQNGFLRVDSGGFIDNDGGSLSNVTMVAPCFVRGSRIDTARGEVAVQDLAIGDHVRTESGRLRPVVWLGMRRVACDRHPDRELVDPVRVRRDAFGPDRPHRDLWLSPDHAVFADGVLIPIKQLINGRTIARIGVTTVEYWHVELDAHDVLLAEGLAVESYLDTGNREQFSDVPRHADFSRRSWAEACAPLCLAGAALTRVRRSLLARAEALGHRRQGVSDLLLAVAGQPVRALSVRGQVHSFLLPAGTASVRLVTPAGVPAELDPEATDLRRLGVAVGGVVANGRNLPLDGAVAGDGFHAGDGGWRWTDGDAGIELAAAGVRGPVVLELLIRGFASAWVDGGGDRPAPSVAAAHAMGNAALTHPMAVLRTDGYVQHL